MVKMKVDHQCKLARRTIPVRPFDLFHKKFLDTLPWPFDDPVTHELPGFRTSFPFGFLNTDCKSGRKRNCVNVYDFFAGLSYSTLILLLFDSFTIRWSTPTLLFFYLRSWVVSLNSIFVFQKSTLWILC